MGQQMSACLELDQGPKVCPSCEQPGNGKCKTCKGEGGWVRQRDVMRNEKKKVIGDNGEPKYMDVVVWIDMPEYAPCFECGGNPAHNVQLHMTNRGINPFASGNQSHAGKEASPVVHASLHPGDSSPPKGGWRGSGKCHECQGTGYIEPLARRLAFDD